MFVDPIKSQTFDYANQIPCENNPQNVIALVRDTDDYFVLTPQSIKKDSSLLFEPTQIQTAFIQTPLLPKMLVFFLKRDSNIFGSEFYLQNTQIIPYNSLIKPLVLNSCVNNSRNFYQIFP